MTAKKGKRRQSLRDDESFPVMKPRELADMLGVQVDTLRKWRVEGRGPKFIRETKRSTVYLRSSVMEWLKRSEKRVQITEKRHRAPKPKAAPLDGSASDRAS